ncbi:MAG: hypothetical protein ACTSYI_15300 [Promethearchaeota archaeon]
MGFQKECKGDNFQPFPPTTIATEVYTPNVPVAKQNLEHLGVYVREIIEGDPLPFSVANLIW